MEVSFKKSYTRQQDLLYHLREKNLQIHYQPEGTGSSTHRKLCVVDWLVRGEKKKLLHLTPHNKIHSGTGFPIIRTIGIVFVVGGFPMYYVMFNSVPGLHLLHTSRTTIPLVVKNETVSRHHQVFPTTVLHQCCQQNLPQ